jgi:hypothetical protein
MKKIYSVLDRESNTFIPPFSTPTNRDAIENFKVVVNDEKTNFCKFPKDFALFYLGEFDEREGTYKNLTKELIAEAIDLKILEKENL